MLRGFGGLILSSLLAATAPSHAETVSGERAAWLDETTGLLWTATDNGYALDAAAAHAWCRELRTGGCGDWRLPTLDELAALYEKKSAQAIRIRPPLVLSPGGACLWSSTRGACCRQLPAAWGLDFTDGSARGGGQLPGRSEGADWRAICVRGAVSAPGS